jgi:pimeloyl-ACP methyl ester carboxylesterase
MHDLVIRGGTLRFIPTAGHWVQREEPEIANEMLTAWLRDEPVPEADSA